jgi:hypothetical protein
MKRSIILGSSKAIEEYLQELNSIDGIKIQGYLDPDDSNNYNLMGDLIQLLEIIDKGDLFIVGNQVDSVDIDVLSQMIRYGKHIFVDGFRHWSTHEINTLEKLRNESQTVLQFGNTLYGRPIFTTAQQFIKKPRFIKLEKFSKAPVKGQFESWIFKNLSEDLDIILRLMNCGVRSVNARPMFLFGEQTDLLNIHIEFDNDSICQISMGRAIDEGKHLLKVYQQDKLFDINFAENQLSESRYNNNLDQLKLDYGLNDSVWNENENQSEAEFITLDRPIMPYHSKRMELRKFIENIDKRLTPLTNLQNLQLVSDLSEWICEKVKRRYQTV